MNISEEHKRALDAMDAGSFAEAADLLGKAPERDRAWIVKNDLALCRSMCGDVDGAVELLDAVLAEDPGNGFAAINRHYVMEAERARRLEPPDPAARIERTLGKGPPSPLVSVIMPTFNRADMIRESVESVLGQEMSDFELIVVNDGGGREVEKTLETYQSDPRVRYAYASHGGTASAINTGISLARGKLIAYLDDDDVYYPDHLSVLTGFFKDKPGARAAHTLVYRARQRKREGQWESVKNELAYGCDTPPDAWRRQIQVPNRNPLMHRRELIHEIGGAPEWLEYTEDWEFYLRLIRACELHCIPKVTGEFRVREGGEQKTRRPKGPRNHCRNLIIYVHGIFPLCGRRFLPTGQGSGARLLMGLARLIEYDRSLITSLELRKLNAEPHYSIFHRLGKDLLMEGRRREARAVFRMGLAVNPLAFNLYFRALA